MMWLLIGAAVIVIGGAGFLADRYGHRKPKPPGKHAMTAEFKVVENETAPGYADYRTADIPKITDLPTSVSMLAVQAPVEEITIHEQVKPVAFLPPVPARTDTVMMEAVNPADYPDWINDELTKL